MIHYGECRINLDAGLHVAPIKVVQGVVNVELEFSQKAGAAPAPAQIIITGEHAAEVYALLALMGGPDAELAANLREGLPKVAGEKTDAECAAETRKMAWERLMELQGDDNG